MKILLGVTGSIAAYKAASVTSALVSRGHEVRVCMTEAATKFVGPVTFSALSHQPVILDEDEFRADGHILHIEMAQEWAEKVVVAPASYDFIGKILGMRADDALSAICAAWRTNILVCPAMNDVMWRNLARDLQEGAMQDRVRVHEDPSDHIMGWDYRTLDILAPAAKKLACGTEGTGALRPTRDIVTFIESRG